MASSSSPPSLANPPNAPKKPSLFKRRRGMLSNIPKLVLPEDEPTPEKEWRALARSGYVRPKFLLWNPEDVHEMDDWDTLMWLREKYHPFSQPQNSFEEAYLQLMLDAINDRMYIM
jgi:hypothetical protein